MGYITINWRWALFSRVILNRPSIHTTSESTRLDLLTRLVRNDHSMEMLVSRKHNTKTQSQGVRPLGRNLESQVQSVPLPRPSRPSAVRTRCWRVKVATKKTSNKIKIFAKRKKKKKYPVYGREGACKLGLIFSGFTSSHPLHSSGDMRDETHTHHTHTGKSSRLVARDNYLELACAGRAALHSYPTGG